jgi:hypothetical protein
MCCFDQLFTLTMQNLHLNIYICNNQQPVRPCIFIKVHIECLKFVFKAELIILFSFKLNYGHKFCVCHNLYIYKQKCLIGNYFSVNNYLNWVHVATKCVCLS